MGQAIIIVFGEKKTLLLLCKRHLGELVSYVFHSKSVYLHMVEIGMPGCCIHVGAKGQVKFSFPGLCSLDLI